MINESQHMQATANVTVITGAHGSIAVCGPTLYCALCGRAASHLFTRGASLRVCQDCQPKAQGDGPANTQQVKNF
jgi:hypothetical protein